MTTKTTPNFTIQPVQQDDYKEWLPLWMANNQGHGSEAVTIETWRRLNELGSGVRGLTVRYDGRLAGFVHYILHPVTGHIEPACYMQDLFIDPAFRRKGLARALVIDLAERAKAGRYARLYWLAEARNEAAQKLYAGIGLRLDFSFHVLPLAF